MPHGFYWLLLTQAKLRARFTMKYALRRLASIGLSPHNRIVYFGRLGPGSAP